MHAYVISDTEKASTKIRQVLLQKGFDCPDSHIVSLSQGANIVRDAELMVLVMSPDPERAILALREMATALGGISLRSAQSKHVLAVGPPDARLILRTIKEGAEEYLDETEIESELQGILGRLIMEARATGKQGKIISFISPSGGSMIACNVATVLAKEHKTACVFDLKLGYGVLDAMFDVKPEYTLADLCSNCDRIDAGMFDKMLSRHASGVRVLSPPNNINDCGYVTADGVHKGLLLARAQFPYVLIDLDRTFTQEQIQAVQMSDMVLLVLRLDFTSLRNTRQTLEHLERLGVSRDKMRLVVNRHGQVRELRLSQAEEALGMKIFSVIPDESLTVNKANNNGVPVVLESPRTKVARSLMDLANSINGQ